MPTDTAFDFESAYREIGGPAVSWRVTGYATEWTEEQWLYIGEGDEDDEETYCYCEPEEIEDRTRVVAHMIGDDQDFTFDVEDLEPIADEDYCPGCGQIGCGWGH